MLALLAATAACKGEEEARARWAPGAVHRTAREANSRGWFDRRGLIHAHSVYSHDACDNEPVKDGVRDESCLDDFRRGLCQTQHDFVMLTDHPDGFSETSYPDTVLYRPGRGDRLLENRANILSCADGSSAVILAGTEGDTMPVGLEEHVADRSLYGTTSSSAIEHFKAKGAVALVAHTENWSLEQLSSLPLDGFEMFNLHANTVLAAGSVLELLVRLDQKDPNLPHPDLVFLRIFSEDERYLERWGTVLARGHKRVTTMGTDCHRNTFPQLAQDGERIDSYRRMMSWFSNHLLLREAEPDDRALKEALKSGRLYGAFEVLGYPRGFDFYADGAEMGGEVLLSQRPVLRIVRPELIDLDPDAPPPIFRLVLWRAIEGGFEEVQATEDASLTFEVDRPGAYRAEVRMKPRHLTAFLGDSAREVTNKELPWIYSNPIYVVP